MNKQIGIIGIGSMGKMLLNGLIRKEIVHQKKISVSTKTKEKLTQLKKEYPDITVFENNSDVAKNSDLLFICVKPMEVGLLLDEILPSLCKKTHLVSIAACVTIGNLEKKIKGKLSKIVPSLTSEIFEGISLVTHNNQVTKQEKDLLETILEKISSVKKIQEKDVEIAGDLTSCAPGLIAAIFDEFVKAALPFASFSKEEAAEMVVKTLYGTSKLIHDRKMSFSETLERVATKGGITEEGAKVLQKRLPEVFKEVFQKTLEKHETVKAKITSLF